MNPVGAALALFVSSFLAGAGKIGLDRPVFGSRVTPRQLLAHTSGIGDRMPLVVWLGVMNISVAVVWWRR